MVAAVNDGLEARRGAAKRTALLLGAVALAFFVATFFLLAR